MIKVTNIAPGPRGVHNGDSILMLAPGETGEADISKANLEAAKKTGWFTFEGQSAKEVETAYGNMTDDELRALLADKGIAADGRWGHDKLVAEAKKAVAKD